MPGSVRFTAVLVGTVVVGALAIAVLAIGWRLDGGRWYDVTTPSMGTAAPVGSLLLTKPATVDATSVGDIVTFRNPSNQVVYSHRVVEKTAAGLSTQGDVNPVRDASTLTDRELLGTVVWHAPGLGFLVRALPLVGVGLCLVWLATVLLPRAQRPGWRVLGSCVTVAVVSLVVRPWVGLVKLGERAAAEGAGRHLDVISTGLLPVRAQTPDGLARVSLSSGEAGTVTLGAGADAGEKVTTTLVAVLDLGVVGWSVLVLVCLSPLLWCLVVGLPPLPEPARRPAHVRRA